MKHSVMYSNHRVSASRSILFTFHLADDIVRGFEPGTPTNPQCCAHLCLWRTGTLVLLTAAIGGHHHPPRRPLCLVVPLAHVRRGSASPAASATASGHFFSSGR